MTVLTQGLSGFSNFALTFVGLTMLSRSDFVLVAAASLAAQLIVVLTRAVVVEPVLAISRPNDALRRLWSTASLLVAPFAIVAAASTLMLSGPLRGLLLAVFACAPLLAAQEANRQAALASQHAARALLLELAWLTPAAMGTSLLVATNSLSPIGLIGCWLFGAAISATVGAALTGVVRPDSHHVQIIRERSARVSVASACMAGASQVATALIAIPLGSNGFAQIRAAQTLLGPIRIAPQVARIFGLRLAPQLSTRLAANERAHRIAAITTLAYVVVAAVALLAVGDSSLPWHLSVTVLAPLGAADAVNVMTARHGLALRLKDRYSTLMRFALVSTPVAILSPLLCARIGAAGAAVGFLIAEVIRLAIFSKEEKDESV